MSFLIVGSTIIEENMCKTAASAIWTSVAFHHGPAAEPKNKLMKCNFKKLL